MTTKSKPAKRKPGLGLRVTVGGWGVSSSGKVTVVQPHEVRMLGEKPRRKAG